MKFNEFDLHPSLLKSIEQLKFEECTPIQAATLPHVFEGRDVAGLAQTGTGKTAAFLLPLMDRVLRSMDPSSTSEAPHLSKRVFEGWAIRHSILILVPTRELAEQVYENAVALKGDSQLRCISIYGGVGYDKQKQALSEGVEFIIATPGRLIDLYKENLVDLKCVRAIVFDEADRMFDMGFKDDMKYILSRIPKERQFLVFSATLNLDVMETAYQFGANPVEIDVSRDQPKAENVKDQIMHVGQNEKPMYLLSLLKKHQPQQVIIFTNFKMSVPRITQFLNDNKFPTVGISSLLTQAQRNRVIEQFKGENDRNILVATDVAARGLDIKGVDLVINYDLPDDPENYVHRIGRTGRAGAEGCAFSLVSDRDVDALSRIETYLRHKLETGWLEETDLVKEFRHFPSDHGHGYQPRQPKSSQHSSRRQGSSSQHAAASTADAASGVSGYSKHAAGSSDAQSGGGNSRNGGGNGHNSNARGGRQLRGRDRDRDSRDRDRDRDRNRDGGGSQRRRESGAGTGAGETNMSMSGPSSHNPKQTSHNRNRDRDRDRHQDRDKNQSRHHRSGGGSQASSPHSHSHRRSSHAGGRGGSGSHSSSSQHTRNNHVGRGGAGPSGSSKASARPAPAGLGQKISSFFKKLFG